MPKKSITITLTEKTQEQLGKLCSRYGLRKSQAIAYVINTVAEQLPEKGEADAN